MATAPPTSDPDQYKLTTGFFGAYVIHGQDQVPQLAGSAGRWTDVKLLGEGGQGSVTLEVRAEPEGERAVKKISRHLLRVNDLDIMRELHALIAVRDHEDLFVKFFGWYDDKDFIYLAMEYLPHGDLGQYLKDNGSEAKKHAQGISKQLLNGISILHQKQICHRDLKPQNVLISCLSPVQVKLADFGISKCAIGTRLQTRLGTENYMAPELLGLLPREVRCGLEYTNAIDLWALGCLIYELLTLENPFQDRTLEINVSGVATSSHIPVDTYLLSEFCKGNVQLPTESLRQAGAAESAIEFIQSLLVADPRSRMLAADGMKHEWLAGGQAGNYLHIAIPGSDTVSTTQQRPKIILSPSSPLASIIPAEAPLPTGEDEDHACSPRPTTTVPLDDSKPKTSCTTDSLISCTGVRADPNIGADDTDKSTKINLRVDTPGVASDNDSDSSITKTDNLSATRSPYRHSFESTLFLSRPYKRIVNSSAISLESSQRPKPRWSLFSGRSDDSVLSFPQLQEIGSRTDLPETSACSPSIPTTPHGTRKPGQYPNITSSSIPAKAGITRNQLCAAAARGKLEPVVELVEQGANLETTGKDGMTPLMIAASYGLVAVVQLLLERGVNRDARSRSHRTALHYAALSGYEGTVKLLLDAGAEIEARNKSGHTPLHDAVRQGLRAIVRLLLDRGANKEARNKSGHTALQYAAERGYEELIDLLLDQGADIRTTDNQLQTSLHIAAFWGNEDSVRLLLERGADKDARDARGATALHEASYHGHGGVVQLLLERGANPKIRTFHGLSPLRQAQFARRRSTVQILKNWEPGTVSAKNTMKTVHPPMAELDNVS